MIDPNLWDAPTTLPGGYASEREWAQQCAEWRQAYQDARENEHARIEELGQARVEIERLSRIAGDWYEGARENETLLHEARERANAHFEHAKYFCRLANSRFKMFEEALGIAEDAQYVNDQLLAEIQRLNNHVYNQEKYIEKLEDEAGELSRQIDHLEGSLYEVQEQNDLMATVLGGPA